MSAGALDVGEGSQSLGRCEGIRLPVEIISTILSHLDQSTLATAALVSRFFRHEVERYLYRSVSLTNITWLSEYLDACGASPDRYERLVEFSGRGIGAEVLLELFFRDPDYKNRFKNLTSIVCKAFHPFRIGPLEPTISHSGPSLRSLICDAHLDLDFIGLLRTQSELRCLEVSFFEGSGTANADKSRAFAGACPNLRDLSCHCEDLSVLGTGRPIEKLVLSGDVDPLVLSVLVFPTIQSFTSATLSLTIKLAYLPVAVAVSHHPISLLAYMHSSNPLNPIAPKLVELVLTDFTWANLLATAPEGPPTSVPDAELLSPHVCGILESLASLKDLKSFVWMSRYAASWPFTLSKEAASRVVQNEIQQRCPHINCISFIFL